MAPLYTPLKALTKIIKIKQAKSFHAFTAKECESF
jgi:hypothetical protein